MILTVEGLSGEPGALGASTETVPTSDVGSRYNRAALLTLAGLTAMQTLFGVLGIGWYLATANVLMVLASVLIAATGSYLFLGILKEFANLEILTKYAA